MRTLPILFVTALASVGCSKEQPAPAPSPSPSASAPTPPAMDASAPIAAAVPSAAPSAVEPPHDCPGDSAGAGSFAKPCEAKGRARAMDVKWTKTGDKGPSFAVTNKMKLVILYGRIAVYFYDKAGKQLDVADESVTPPKRRPFHTCSGVFFGGVMNPAERGILNFSCVPKSVIPDGAATVEAEMQMVGFADASGKKVDFYWRNMDIDARRSPQRRREVVPSLPRRRSPGAERPYGTDRATEFAPDAVRHGDPAEACG